MLSVANTGLSGLHGFEPNQISGLKAWYKADQGVITDGAASFASASSEYLSIASNSTVQLPNGDYTLCGWAKISTLANNRDILAKTDFASSHEFFVFVTAAGQLRHSAYNTVPAAAIDLTVAGVSNATWFFWCCRRSGTTIGLSLNGGAFTTGTFSGTQNQANNTLHFGRYSTAYYNGEMDSIGKWDRALSDVEVASLYNSGSGKTYADLTTAEKVSLVSWWDLDELSGTRNDSHGSNHLTDNNTVTAAAGITAGIASDNDPVKQWTDLSGNGLHLTQSTHAAKPTFKTNIQGGFPAVRTDGTDDTILNAAWGLTQPFHFAYAVKQTRSGYTSDQLFYRSSNPVAYTNNGSSDQYAMFSGSVVNSAVADSTDAKVHQDVWNTTASYKYLNGTAIIDNQDTGSSNMGSQINFGSSAAVTNLMAADFLEIIVYSRLLTAAERAMVETYLNQRYKVY